mmetsp:Transcript_33667/g.88171  ORF Transcript_33667/g.88171 Transcript_33667/m.88171 type:complete len:216 (-) Transcript_33667:309-956(-)
MVRPAGLQAEGGVAGELRFLRRSRQQEHADPRYRARAVLHALQSGQDLRGVRAQWHSRAAFGLVRGVRPSAECAAPAGGWRQVAHLHHADAHAHPDGAGDVGLHRRGPQRGRAVRGASVRHAGRALRFWRHRVHHVRARCPCEARDGVRHRRGGARRSQPPGDLAVERRERRGPEEDQRGQLPRHLQRQDNSVYVRGAVPVPGRPRRRWQHHGRG